MAQSPVDRHAASPAELKERLEAERSGSAFVLYRDGEGRQQLLPLEDGSRALTIGRGNASDIWLSWDTEVSRVHAELQLVGDDWTLADDGLSSNGSFVNGERVRGRRRLRDGDELRFGKTVAVFRKPAVPATSTTKLATDQPPMELSDMQRKVLAALCRPYRDGAAFATPATNQEIAEQVYLSVDAVKSHLRALFAKFAIEGLPQNQKRARLVELAFQRGVIERRDLG
ncbi:MAG TPA: FHA domain-containing protein [Thermoleophilaceae bacterium]|jgi:pSer/pThr/pTyr-binding forkhead associated (FHA) protein